MQRLFTLIKILMIIWGGVALAAVIGIGGYLAYQWGPGNRDQIDAASPHDVRFILNRCGLGEQRLERVAHSRVSARSVATRARS